MNTHSEIGARLQALCQLEGVRGAMVATPDGALEAGAHSGIPANTANDISKTVRRMTVASTTMGAPLSEMLVNLGREHLLLRPVDDDRTLVVILERKTKAQSVREGIAEHVKALGRLLEGRAAESNVSMKTDQVVDGDEVDQLLAGELGPLVNALHVKFAAYMTKLGKSGAEIDVMMREQVREWLLCCSPSPYTFPLLLDGLSQLLNEQPQLRAQFMSEVQEGMRKNWSRG